MPSTAVRWETWRLAGGQTVPAAPLSLITFPASPLMARVEIALGADPAANPATWSWLDISQWVRYSPEISISRGRPDESSTVDASKASLSLDNRDGRFCRRNPYGPYFGLLSKNTPIRIGVDPGDGVHWRYHGFVNEWPTRWSDRSATDSTVPIVCGGVLRRMQQGQRLKSALFRSVSGVAPGDYTPIAYWPLEDGSSATQFASGLVGGSAVSVPSGVTPAADSTIVGSDPLPTFDTAAALTIPMPSYAATDRWFIPIFIKIPARPSVLTTYASIPVSGGPVRWVNFAIDGSAAPYPWRMRALDASGALMSEVSILIPDSDPIPSSAVYDNWVTVVMGIRPSSTPGNYVVWGHVGVPGYADIGGGGPGGTGAVGQPTSVTIYGIGGISAGHVALFADTNFDALADSDTNTQAIAGWAGEMAHERAIRLCREEDVPLVCTSAYSATMGPQISGSLLDNLRACESADGGVLYEHEFGLGYQSLDDRLNAPVQLQLDFDQRHVADTPEPADDDQRLTNRVTVTRSGGSSSTQQDDDSIAESGLFETSTSLNLYADSQAAEAASWKVWLGTVNEDRWPAIPIRLHGTPDLIGPWTSLPYGSRMTLANPPDEMAPDTIDAIVEGWSERITPHAWDASLNTTPASPYRVGRVAAESGYADLAVGWTEADSCELAADVTTTDTSWSVNTTPLASTDTDDFGFLIEFGGEIVYVNSITGGSNPQTWDVGRSVNGVVVAHLTGTTGELVNPVIPVP